MTKKDYELIAAVLRKHHAPADLAVAMADALALDNPRFDRLRFMSAAGFAHRPPYNG